MTKKGLTEIVFILDRSGSMDHLVNDTIGGFNSFVEKQKQEEGEAFLTTVLFDHQYEILHNRVNIQKIAPITDKEYYARGNTALLDAVGRTINKVGNRLSRTNEDDRPENVMVIITTDGYENSSREFTYDRIKEMIKHQTEKYNWKFLFLGANMDAAAVADNMGIMGAMASNYTADAHGTRSLYDGVGRATKSLRSSGEVTKGWDDDIT